MRLVDPESWFMPGEVSGLVEGDIYADELLGSCAEGVRFMAENDQDPL